ncbi:glycoside hydrolase, family 25 [Lactococcus termiticola]|uniref:DUF5648 domain-containing protein n=1 Tax=Lactococcus termiticola TaxID=2169526 RepID=A0A2R5HGJ8_9LACT|nr:glycoside hydrolase, family 25 [Lactococcus termiticola]GBG97112.1 hypothetical protein NtB2_01249 [Lactococcus termiticola]
MNKKLVASGLVAFALLGSVAFAKEASANSTIYRLYNTNNQAHLWTSSTNEAQSLPGIDWNWNYEGRAWVAPSKGTNIYRVYNPKSGEHIYTESTNEVDVLSKNGWRSEGVAFHSADKWGKPVYRLFNAKAGIGAHFVTLSSYERDQLVKSGWKYEGIAWRALGNFNWTKAQYNALKEGSYTGAGGTSYSSIVSQHGNPQETSTTEYGNITYLAVSYNNSDDLIDQTYRSVTLLFVKQANGAYNLVDKSITNVK